MLHLPKLAIAILRASLLSKSFLINKVEEIEKGE